MTPSELPPIRYGSGRTTCPDCGARRGVAKTEGKFGEGWKCHGCGKFVPPPIPNGGTNGVNGTHGGDWKTPKLQPGERIAGTYRYWSVEGVELRKYRIEGPDGKRFLWQKGPTEFSRRPHTPQLYGADQIAGASVVALVEGEACAEALREIGIAAVSLWDGAQSVSRWGERHTDAIRGAQEVWLLPDDDEPGREAMDAVAATLEAARVPYRIVGLPGLPEHGDVVDWLRAEREAGNISEAGLREALALLAEEAERVGEVVEEGAESLVYRPRLDVEPPRYEPVLMVGDVRIGSIGNCTTVVAGAGSGKSALCDATVAKAVRPDCQGLLIDVTIPDGRGVVYVDTERTQEDHWESFRRAMRRAGIQRQDDVPPWLRFSLFSLLLSNEQRMAALVEEIEAVNAALVIVDGIGDFVTDPNDTKEVATMNGWVIALAKRLDFALMVTLHPNPNDPDKARGHLGSDLWRRSESYLTLVKDHKTEQRTLTSKGRLGKVRSGRDVEGYFAWDDDARMFLPCDNRTAATGRLELIELADRIFAGVVSLGYTELWTAIRNDLDTSMPTAKRRVKAMEDENLIYSDGAKKHRRFYRNENEPF